MGAPGKMLPALLRHAPVRGRATMALSPALEAGGKYLAALVPLRGGAAETGPIGKFFLGDENVVAFKLGLAFALCAFNALCWGAPLRYKRFTGNPKKLSIASTFSGGVFLALAFGHMMPEAASAFGAGGARPACLWTLAGYLLIWSVERWSAPAHAPPDFGHNAVPAPGGEGEAKAHGGSAAMLLGALSVHSMLETMALAVARTKTAALLLSASIALHQPAESLALVVALLRSGMPSRRLLRLLLTFTAMGPIGAGLGLGLQRAFGGAIGGALDGALIALTAGTFVYVGATEVIPEEFEGENASKAKVLALVAGVCTILGLAHFAEVLEASI